MNKWFVDDGVRQMLSAMTDENLKVVEEIHQRNKRGTPESYRLIEKILGEYRQQGGLNNLWQEYKLFSLWQLLCQRRPHCILELGAGTSTAIFAAYIRECAGAHLTSVDEEPHWIETAAAISRISPGDKCFDLHPSPKETGSFLNKQASRYKLVPPRDYDFVFIDGPTISDAVNGVNADVFLILETQRPKTIVIDMREGTARQLFKMYHAEYDAFLSDLFIENLRENYNYFSWFTLKS